jgi:AraC-like DNA-binding protein
MLKADTRVWMDTDRPGEQITLARPNGSMELMSVKGSNRLWTEVHTQVCLCLIRPGQPQSSAFWQTRAQSLHSRSGGLMLIEPGDVHVTLAVTAPADFDVVRFLPELIDEAMRELSLPGEFHFRVPACENPRVSAALSRLIRAHAEATDGFALDVLSTELITSMLTELGETPSTAGVALDPVRDFRLRRVREYLRSHLEQKPSLDHLARELKLSKFRLCKIFKAAYGVSVGQYWMAARIAQASRLLLLGVPIKSVTARLGFADEAFFTRMFRRHRGLPPGAWVRIQQKNSPRAEDEPLLRSARPADASRPSVRGGPRLPRDAARAPARPQIAVAASRV